MQIHGPSVVGPDPTTITVEVNARNAESPFVKVEFPGGIHFYLDDGDADVLIKVFCQAKDMLAGHRHAVANHAGIGEYVNGGLPVADAANLATLARADAAECGATHAAPLGFGGNYVCTEPPGHEPSDHVAMGGDVECARWPVAEGLPVAEDDGGDGDDNREPYCVTCGFTLDAAGEHLYPDDAIVEAHDAQLGWREPVGRPVTQAGRDLQAGALAAEQTARDMENAQSAEVRRIGKLHTDGLITAGECAEMVDKVLGEHA